MENKFNANFTMELLQALHVAFPTEKEVPDFIGADYSVKGIVIWFILNRADNRAKDFMEPDGDSVTIKLINGFSIDPMQCHLKQWPDLIVDFSPDDQDTHTQIYKAWQKLAEGISKPATITFGHMAERGPVESDYSGAILNLSQPEISPEMVGLLLKDPEVPTHPAGLVPREPEVAPELPIDLSMWSVQTIWSQPNSPQLKPSPREEIGVLNEILSDKPSNGSFRSSVVYEPLKEFLVALSQDPVPMAAILTLTQADKCRESHFFVGNGKLQNLTLEIDDYKVEITSGALCRRVGLKVINRSTLTSLEINAEDFENLLAEL